MALSSRSSVLCLNSLSRSRPATPYHTTRRSFTSQHQPRSFRCNTPSARTHSHTRSFSSTSISSNQQSSSPTPATSSSPTYTYQLAASFCGKSHAFNPSSHYFTFSSNTNTTLLSGHIKYTRNSGRIPSGQDACFVSRLGDSGIALGLADGVGGWADQGIDPSDFSHGLCNRMAEEAESYEGEGKEKDLPRRILQRAFDDISKDESIQGGGSTACVGVADWQGKLTAANLGDSGFAHIRLSPLTLLHVSPHQTHAFNTPYQLSQIPPNMRRKITQFGEPLGDQPRDAALSSHTLQHGDVVIYATDGVWDNLDNGEILRLVVKACRDAGVLGGGKMSDKQLALATREGEDLAKDKQGHNLQAAIATSIVSAAKKAGLDEERNGPFARAVQKAYPGERYQGGKPDDVCVIVMIAMEEGRVGGAKL